MTSGAERARFRTSDGTSIAYTLRRAAADDAPRLALVHSLALDRSVWDGVVEALDGRASILAFDCRGHGESGRPAGVAFTAELFARDLAELLDHVGWPTAAIGGCSMGGCVAMAFAGLYPTRATALGLIDTTAWYGPEAPQQFRARAEAARAGGMAGLVGFQRARWFSAPFLTSHEDTVAHVVEVFLANDFDCYARSCALLGDADLRPYLPSCRMPVSILVGAEDQATPPTMSQVLREALPHATLTIVDGARHLTPIERPDRVAAALLALLRAA